MKEASGEANLTVVTIILIGVIVAIATPIINSMMTNTGRKACCMNAGSTWRNNACMNSDDTENTTYWDEENNRCNDGTE